MVDYYIFETIYQYAYRYQTQKLKIVLTLMTPPPQYSAKFTHVCCYFCIGAENFKSKNNRRIISTAIWYICPGCVNNLFLQPKKENNKQPTRIFTDNAKVGTVLILKCRSSITSRPFYNLGGHFFLLNPPYAYGLDSTVTINKWFLVYTVTIYAYGF